MKKQHLFLYLAIICLFTGFYCVHEIGSSSRLTNPFLYQTVFPPLRRLSSLLTDLKFKIRGTVPPASPVVILEVDSRSIEEYGRWPWSRILLSELIQKTFHQGALVIGLDMVLSEPEKNIPDGLSDTLKNKGLGKLVNQFQTDPKLAATIGRRQNQLVLGWMTESHCQPLFSSEEACPVSNQDAIELLPQTLHNFEYGNITGLSNFNRTKTPISSAFSVISNLEMFDAVSLHQGFLNSFRDPDGIIRRTGLVMMVDGLPHPSFALKMAEVAKGIAPRLVIKDQRYVDGIFLDGKNGALPVSSSGIADINFRGPERTFSYVSARDVLETDPNSEETSRSLAGESPLQKLKGAVVVLGVTALAVSDFTATPFDGVVAGSEVQATVIDNLLSGQLIVGRTAFSFWATFLLMTIGAFLFVWISEKLEAIPVIGCAGGTLGATFLIDAKLLFPANFNWSSGFLYAEVLTLSAFIIAKKYMAEEGKRKFIRTAFSKYVSPAVVDTLMKDPTSLHLGGHKTNLTMLFSDIRNFTTFSETMDANRLAEFLNEYFNLMTSILFQFNGTLDKFIGDAVMAFFGAPHGDPEHARKACEAARTMQRVLTAHRSLFKSKYGIEVKIGIGLNSGPVSVGNMGSNQNFNYTVIGDAVNLASRLEGATKQYGVGILTTHLTLAEVQAAGEMAPPFRLVDVIQVKGKSEAVQLLQLLEEEASPDGLMLFEEGRELYHDRAWDKAIEKFRSASVILSHEPQKMDGPSAVFIERCELLKTSPPPPDWDGTWSLDSK